MSDITSEIQAIEEDMAFGDSSQYWHDEGLRQRYGELLEARDSGGPAPAGPSRNEARLRELEGLMADGMSDYWRGQRADQLQREYADLLEGRVPPSAFDAVAEARRESGERTVGDALGLDAGGAQEMAQRIDSAFQHLDTRDLDQAYSAMSGEAQWALLRLLSDPSTLRDAQRTEEFVNELSDEAWTDLRHFETSMLPEEHQALKQALLLT